MCVHWHEKNVSTLARNIKVSFRFAFKNCTCACVRAGAVAQRKLRITGTHKCVCTSVRKNSLFQLNMKCACRDGARSVQRETISCICRAHTNCLFVCGGAAQIVISFEQNEASKKMRLRSGFLSSCSRPRRRYDTGVLSKYHLNLRTGATMKC